jgi:hypothetical protein
MSVWKTIRYMIFLEGVVLGANLHFKKNYFIFNVSHVLIVH